MTDNETNSGSIIVMLCLISSVGRYVLDSYLPSLPALANYFAISSDNVQLTISYYLLGFSLSQLIYGPFSDSFGRKRTLVIGLNIFSLASMACALIETSFNTLLVFRFLAGLGGGACGVLNRAIASDCFEGDRFSKAWSYTTTSLVLTLILAPMLGGYIQEFYSWQANFVFATLYVAVILLIVIKFLPETHAKDKRVKWHTRSIFKNYSQVLQTRSFLVASLCYTCAFAGLIAYFQVSPLLFIGEFGLTPAQYGFTSIVIAGCYLVGGALVSKLVIKLGSQRMLDIGLICMAIAGFGLFIIGELHLSRLNSVLFPVALYVIGARIVIANAIAEAFMEVRQHGGTASALMGTMQMFGAAIVSVCLAQFKHPTIILLGVCLCSLGLIAMFSYSLFAVKDVGFEIE